MVEVSPQLQQYVPSSVCLKCEGCCRFQASDSLWRPKGPDADYVATIADCGKHLCRFFNPADHTCQVYANRPFDCVLYPFLLSASPEGIKVFVHLACPYVQDTEQDPRLSAYIKYLQKFFAEPKTTEFLKRNPHVVGDYSNVELELRYLFTLPNVQT